MKIETDRAIIVEGRYDRIKLDSMTRAIVITTDGFNIFKDIEKQELIKRLAEEIGLIVLTDSDDAGFKIRKYIVDIAKKENILHAYIPELFGKEKRKQKRGAAGLLGVEGVDIETLKKALLDALGGEQKLEPTAFEQKRMITVTDLFEDGLNGCAGASVRRERLLRAAALPTRLSTNAVLELLNRLIGYEQYKKLLEEINND